MLVEFIEQETGYGLAVALDNHILNGGDAEDGTEVAGILTDGAVKTTAFTADALTSLGFGLGELENAGVTPNAVALNADDWRDLQLLRENGDTGKYLLDAGPHDIGTKSVWGTPIVLVDGLPAGTAIAGDFSAATVKSRGNNTLAWTEKGQYTELVDDGQGGTTEKTIDLFSRNLMQVRAEGRFALEISRPTALRKVAITA